MHVNKAILTTFALTTCAISFPLLAQEAYVSRVAPSHQELADKSNGKCQAKDFSNRFDSERVATKPSMKKVQRAIDKYLKPGQGGPASILIYVDTSGHVIDADVNGSSGSNDLDLALMDWGREFTAKPGPCGALRVTLMLE